MSNEVAQYILPNRSLMQNGYVKKAMNELMTKLNETSGTVKQHLLFLSTIMWCVACVLDISCFRFPRLLICEVSFTDIVYYLNPLMVKLDKLNLLHYLTKPLDKVCVYDVEGTKWLPSLTSKCIFIHFIIL